MTFRDAQQRAAVCSTLLRSAGRDGLFTAEGPTPIARELRAGDASPMPMAQRLLFQLAWAIWDDDSGIVTFEEVLRLPPARLRMVGGLLASIGSGIEAIDAWLEEWASEGASASSSDNPG